MNLFDIENVMIFIKYFKFFVVYFKFLLFFYGFIILKDGLCMIGIIMIMLRMWFNRCEK